MLRDSPIDLRSNKSVPSCLERFSLSLCLSSCTIIPAPSMRESSMKRNDSEPFEETVIERVVCLVRAC